MKILARALYEELQSHGLIAVSKADLERLVKAAGACLRSDPGDESWHELSAALVPFRKEGA